MELTKDNFYLFAAKQYDMTLNTTEDDFEADLKRFLYVKRLLNKFKKGQELKTRLILNHIIIIYNCFGEAATPMLFQRMEDLHPELKPFIVALNYMPKKICYENKILYSSDIPMNPEIIAELRKI
ncbi:hypothetical protein PHIM7_354 [Sinorhizobium phage phiM7]|uniref:Uncharacterized protein n=3 Tax=Emdodecavirus TaxID=1980937 RepID=S5MDL2_9CAUD|nr:hypothetical protein AB690_gp160 [Sinorhizobium phage phiM12]YP_009212599.1 hypothetical protein AVT40_gp174 [Sinorhizobium phage phiN3]YP_009601479.1 hypothetical protein FDH46_gp124 [Sinorhizobium phage phiM7]AKF13259.1 hypothetical protein PHIM19_354 [Sinorhizobium phage phiM19]AGR48089.1 hypothetical protein SmphiM12_457 [Sinorhizobium phage phiM12]AKF12899.1 hypothetical protein PHIM7_354 [Sinorhizobium phage phiM7]AKF13622.1 hypothetical protein PHIN3_359 [Sinorhizobium phage phiN3]